MVRTLNIYKTYSFKDKDPCIDKLRTIIQDEELSLQDISDASGVSIGTLHNWFSGPTKRPQHATYMAAVRGAGYDYRLVRIGKVVSLRKKGAA